MSLVIIISAPSGSGKTTLANELQKRVPGLLFSVSYTTRRPRGTEKQGREYRFVPPDEFQAMVERGEFLEHANVHGNCYGTPKSSLQEAQRLGQDLLLDIDVQGEEQIKRKLPEAISIFILPPSKQVLEERLHGRSYAEKTDSLEGNIQGRLLAATKEIEKYPNYEYILVNDQLSQSVEQLENIVLAERLMRAQRPLSTNQGRTVERAAQSRRENMDGRIREVLASFVPTAAPSGR